MPYNINEKDSDLEFRVTGEEVIIKLKVADILNTKLLWEALAYPSNEQINITHLKDALKDIEIGGDGFFKKMEDAQGNEYIITKYPIATEQGITAYSSNTPLIPSIFDGIPIDNDTIYWDESTGVRILKAKGGGGSGDFDASKMWDLLAASTNEQIAKSHLTTALNGYATESWVTSQGYALQTSLNAVSNKLNNFLEGSDTDNIINKWKELEAFLEGMKESDNLAQILSTKADKTYVDGELKKYVTLSTEQTINGLKHFTNGVTIGAGKHKLYEENGVIYLDGDLAVKGGVTAYAVSSSEVSTVMDGVAVDGITIVKENGKLVSKGGTGSDFDSSKMWELLGAPTNEQIHKEHIINALAGYATESWVTNNYVSKASYTAADVLAKIKSVDGANSGLDADLLDGKHYNEFLYNVNQEYGSSDDVRNIPNWTYFSGNNMINAPTSAWFSGIVMAANNNSKYKAILGVSDNHTLFIGGNSNGVWREWEKIALITSNVASATKLQTARKLWGNNFDGTSDVFGNLMVKGSNGIQNVARITLAMGDDDTGFKWISDGICQMYANNVNIGQWSSGGMNWTKAPKVNGKKIWYEDNDGSGSGLDADTLDGLHHYSFVHAYGDGFLGANLTNQWVKFATFQNGTGYNNLLVLDFFNAESGTRNSFGRLLIDIRQNAVRKIHISNFGSQLIQDIKIVGGNNYNKELWMKCTTGTYEPFYTIQIIQKNSISNLELGLLSSQASEPVGSVTNVYATRTGYAARLVTSRDIWGQSFDGSQNVSGLFSLGGTNKDILTIEDKGTYRMIQSYGSKPLCLNPVGNNVGVGTNSPSQKLHVAGNILATGGITCYSSDQRAKTVISKIDLSLQDIANSPTIRFRWNGWKVEDDGKTHIGGIAQYVERLLPEVILDTNDFKNMDYATTAYIYSVCVARSLRKTDTEVERLEKRVSQLEARLKKYENNLAN